MAISSIVEFTIAPGRRDEFVKVFQSLFAQHEPSLRAAGCLGSTLYAAVEDPDVAVEIAEWESAEAREKMMQSEVMSEFAPLFDLLAAPFRATVVEPLS